MAEGWHEPIDRRSAPAAPQLPPPTPFPADPVAPMTTFSRTIDLRSDTVTRPTGPMRRAMASAEVGDDQFGEDPTVNRLQERVADLLGKPAALWLPTGTMANQVALRILTRPGDDVVVPEGSHVVLHESGAAPANAGVLLTQVGAEGSFSAEEMRAAVKPRGHIVLPPTTLVTVENTHNLAGGVVFPLEEAERIGRAARELDVRTYLDGARLWHAAIATGRSVADLAAPFDVVSIALSKGLGAPAGSLLAGPDPLIRRAVRYRRMFGGAMRQVGILAAAGLHALDHHVERLAEDHDKARAFAEVLAGSPSVGIEPGRVHTNIVRFGIAEPGFGTAGAQGIAARAAERGVLVFPFGPRTLRAVTHLDVTREDCLRAAEILCDVLEEAPR